MADDEKGEEGQEWCFEVVGEEVENTGEVRCVDIIKIPESGINHPTQTSGNSYEVLT